MNCWRSIPNRRAKRSTSSSLKVGLTSLQQFAQLVQSIPAQTRLVQLKDALIQLRRVQLAPLLQEPAESPVLILLLFGRHAQLERFDGHRTQEGAGTESNR